MKNLLLQKKFNCNDSEIDQFYNHLQRCPNEKCGDCNYSWETTEHGYFLYGKSSVSFFRETDGHVFRLLKWFHPDDGKFLQDIYDISISTNAFRVEKPIITEIVHYEDHNYLYCETARPGNKFGLSGIEECLETDTEHFFIEFINQTAVLLPYIKELSNKYGLGPMLNNLQIHSSRAKDSHGHYWKNLRLFRHPPDKMVKESLKKLILGMRFIEVVKQEHVRIDVIFDHAKSKWLKALDS